MTVASDADGLLARDLEAALRELPDGPDDGDPSLPWATLPADLPFAAETAGLVERGVAPWVARALVRRALQRVTPARGVTVARGPDLPAEIARSVRIVPPPWARARRLVLAFVGASGVGKSRLAAAVALRCAAAGRRPAYVAAASAPPAAVTLALRAAAVPVHLVDDNAGLQLALTALAGADVVLVDPPGVGPFDGPARRRCARLLDHPALRRHLVLPATGDPHDLPDIIASWAEEEGAGLEAVAVTKLDEARGAGSALAPAFAARIPLGLLATAGGVEAVDPARLAREVVGLPRA